jgi:REP element-mobilizing transposase RayT
MARPLRIAYPGAVYHVTARGNARQAIGRDDADRQRFVATLADTVTQYGVRCHAWVLMPNHYHLLLETPQANLSAALRHLNGVYTQAFNRRHRRVGHLFQGRFTAILVEKERYLLALKEGKGSSRLLTELPCPGSLAPCRVPSASSSPR